MKADLNELLERVRSATGPDRELSLRILTEVGGWAFEKRGRDRQPWMYGPQGERRDPPGRGVFHAPHVTASIDAALALVERLFPDHGPNMVYSYDLNWHASAHAHMSYAAELFVAEGDPCEMVSYHGQAHTLPLAILAALLQALISKESQS